jgi:hypothetical protein
MKKVNHLKIFVMRNIILKFNFIEIHLTILYIINFNISNYIFEYI